MVNTFNDYVAQLEAQKKNLLNPVPFDQYINNNVNQYQTTNPSISSIFTDIGKFRNDAIGRTQKDVLGLYDAYSASTNPVFQKYVSESVPYGRELLGNIDKQQQELTSLYGPQGSQYKLIDDYYTRMGDLINNKARGNQAAITSSAMASGASKWGIASASAKQQSLDTENLLKFQEGKNNALMNTYQMFSQLLWGLQDRASGIRSNYIINPYLELSKRQDALAQSALTNQAAYEQMRLQRTAAVSAAKSQVTNTAANKNPTTPTRLDYFMASLKWTGGALTWSNL